MSILRRRLQFKRFFLSSGYLLLFIVGLYNSSAYAMQKSLWLSPKAVRGHRGSLLKAGFKYHGNYLYVCQANLWGRKQIGRSIYPFKHCKIPFQKKIFVVDRFLLLRNISATWKPMNTQSIHFTGAISLGRNHHNKPLYLCRAWIGKDLVPGKIWPGVHRCITAYGRQVIARSTFQLLTKTL